MSIIECAKCGAKNRIDPVKSGQAICGNCATPLSIQIHPVVITEANFGEEVEKSPLPVLLDLWAVWCGPCRMIAPVIDQLAGELVGRVKVAKLNVDEHPGVSQRFGVRNIPTLLILKNGREVDRIVGAQPKEAIISRLRQHM